MLTDLGQRFGLRRVVFVGDRGMVTSANVALVRARQQGYAVRIYKELREVERAFANLKDVIEMRPIYHKERGIAVPA